LAIVVLAWRVSCSLNVVELMQEAYRAEHTLAHRHRASMI
jgi:hypothetical protein